MPPPADFEQLQSAIAAAYPRLSPQLQQLGRFALERPDEMALGTVAAVAEAAQVQPSALIRFANALGFGGFTELQQPLRARLLQRSASYRERIVALDRARPARHAQPAAEAGVLRRFITDAATELTQLEDNVPGAALAAGAALITGAARVHVLAQRRAFPVAAYLSYALGQLEIQAQLLDGLGGMLGDTLRRIGKRDLLLVASFKPYSPEVVAAAADAKQRGVPVLAITDTTLSPLKPSARVCLELGPQANAAFQSLAAPLCLAQVLVVCAGQRLARLDQKRKITPRRARTTPDGSEPPPTRRQP